MVLPIPPFINTRIRLQLEVPLIGIVKPELIEIESGIFVLAVKIGGVLLFEYENVEIAEVPPIDHTCGKLNCVNVESV